MVQLMKKRRNVKVPRRADAQAIRDTPHTYSHTLFLKPQPCLSAPLQRSPLESHHRILEEPPRLHAVEACDGRFKGLDTDKTSGNNRIGGERSPSLAPPSPCRIAISKILKSESRRNPLASPVQDMLEDTGKFPTPEIQGQICTASRHQPVSKQHRSPASSPYDKLGCCALTDLYFRKAAGALSAEE